ncbi:MAG: ATP-binding protein [Chloroflexota bacterium]|nr:ATP-binding protein [Chloroflexota bacterium]
MGGDRFDRAAKATVSLEPEAWRFLAVSGGPLVFREREGWVMENPFEPPADHWVVIPLVSQLRVLGAVAGSSNEPISLAPAAVARLAVIGDLLSVGAANELLRTEIQRTELQRERVQLAEEIHDSLAQDLAAAVRELALLETRPPAETARASEARLREAVLDAHRVVRRHLEVLGGEVVVPGLAAAVAEVCARFRRRGLAVSIAMATDDDGIDPAAVAVVLRVLNEALANVLRHAGVAQATVSIDADANTLRVCVSDVGRGFDVGSTTDVGSGHFGLAIMRNRARTAAGTLMVRSQPGEGTTVELILPRQASVA